MNLKIEKLKNYFRYYKFADSVFFYYLIGFSIIGFFFLIKAFILMKGLLWLFNFDIPFWKACICIALLAIVGYNNSLSDKE